MILRALRDAFVLEVMLLFVRAEKERRGSFFCNETA